jgi:hypothetical protein
MLKYNNTHIFTGYLKQLLSSFNLPTCRIYTRDFANYYRQYGSEDPRVLSSFKEIDETRPGIHIDYLKNNEICSYFHEYTSANVTTTGTWKQNTSLDFDPEKSVPGLTRNLNSSGITYDTKTHEYLGDYLRFIRDYYNINLMSLYNCFNNKLCNNLRYEYKNNSYSSIFDSQDPNYRIYMIPVKLFAEYTIAIDSASGIELFCGLYNTNLDLIEDVKAIDLAKRTYQKVNKTLFKQPFIYNKLTVENWSHNLDITVDKTFKKDIYIREDIAVREKDLKLFIKIPTACRSTITVLEGNYLGFNDVCYLTEGQVDHNILSYQSNHNTLNFQVPSRHNLNDLHFKPISKLQLLELNTGDSHPFADRLIEYLVGSATTPIDDIPDNIKRAQKVMNQNGYYFKIDGLWENKMKNLLYDYVMNSGPIKIHDGKAVDAHSGIDPINNGYHPTQGHNSKSTLYDVLGYVDKDTEAWYACWKTDKNKAVIKNNIQNIDIYNGLYDID